jgi:branched-chain amino acid transport system permease protein
MKKNKLILTIVAIILLFCLLAFLNSIFNSYQTRILKLCGIYIVLALSLNLINGFTGQFSLGTAGFMAIGAYVSAILTMSPAKKAATFYLEPIVPWLAEVEIGFLPAIIIAGLISALFGFLIGAPVLRLRDDYLAIATLGFSEIIRVVITNLQNVTNGSLGLKGLPSYTNIWWSWGVAVVFIIFMALLIKSSYGRALKAIREDEIAAEAMGINLFRNKLFAFIVSSFMAGVGGALLGHLMGTIDPLMFRFLLTYNILLIVVVGGIGSITGSVIGAIIVTVAMEALRVLDGNIDLGFIKIQGIPGMRMVIFSVLLMVVILFFRRGIMGTNEFNWDWFLNNRFFKKRKKTA